MTSITYYDLLQIEPDANDDTIRHAYRIQAKRHHPDTNPHDRNLASARFRLIQEAYDLLRDPARRAAYDRELSARRWYGSGHRSNDNGNREVTDVFNVARRSLERLMRMMAMERHVGVQSQDDR